QPLFHLADGAKRAAEPARTVHAGADRLQFLPRRARLRVRALACDGRARQHLSRIQRRAVRLAAAARAPFALIRLRPARIAGRSARMNPAIGELWRAGKRALATPVDIASLAAFRILFGLVMCGALVRSLAKGWVTIFFVEPAFHFTYAPFW